MAAKAKAVDWVAVGVDYRAGIKTTTAIGKEHGISHTAVQKRAKAEGWTRDLSKRIEAAREAKVARAMVSPKVSEQRAATETEVVQANADVQTGILLAHRRDIQALRQTVLGMAGELGALAHSEIQAALEIVLDEKCDGQNQQYKTALTKAFDAALALGGRSAAGKNLVTSLGVLIDKERQAFGIDKSGQDETLASFLKGLDTPSHATG